MSTDSTSMQRTDESALLVTGAAGRTGGYAARSLLERGHRVRALVRKFDDVRVWSRDSQHAQGLADEIGATAMSAEDAVRGADVIVTATNKGGSSTAKTNAYTVRPDAAQPTQPPLVEIQTSGPASDLGLIGPEGGFSEEEIEIAEAEGALVFGMGPRILRAETAAAAAVTLVQYELGGL